MSRRAALLFESTREGVTLGFCKRKRPAYFLRWFFWWARVSRRAALLKKAPLGLFCPAGRKRRAAAVRIHPRGCDFGFLQKKKDQRIFYAGLFGGRGWIRTTEAESSRFTVCPHWPLGNTPIFYCAVIADRLYILPSKMEFVNSFFDFLFRAGLTGRAPFC